MSATADDFVNPFARQPTAPVSAEVEAWARALCVAWGALPDKIIGFPEAPRWRSWVGYAEFAIKAADALGYAPPAEATPADGPTRGQDGQPKPIPTLLNP